jgi:hypothetical protein
MRRTRDNIRVVTKGVSQTSGERRQPWRPVEGCRKTWNSGVSMPSSFAFLLMTKSMLEASRALPELVAVLSLDLSCPPQTNPIQSNPIQSSPYRLTVPAAGPGEGTRVQAVVRAGRDGITGRAYKSRVPAHGRNAAGNGGVKGGRPPARGKEKLPGRKPLGAFLESRSSWTPPFRFSGGPGEKVGPGWIGEPRGGRARRQPDAAEAPNGGPPGFGGPGQH